jgi:hypothetical protein
MKCPVCGRAGIDGRAERCPQCGTDLEALRLVDALSEQALSTRPATTTGSELPSRGTSMDEKSEPHLFRKDSLGAALLAFVVSLVVVGVYHLFNASTVPRKGSIEPAPSAAGLSIEAAVSQSSEQVKALVALSASLQLSLQANNELRAENTKLRDREERLARELADEVKRRSGAEPLRRKEETNQEAAPHSKGGVSE